MQSFQTASGTTKDTYSRCKQEFYKRIHKQPRANVGGYVSLERSPFTKRYNEEAEAREKTYNRYIKLVTKMSRPFKGEGLGVLLLGYISL